MSPNFENKREQPDFSTMVEKYKKDLMEYQRLQPASQEAVSPKTSPVSQERRNQGSVPVGSLQPRLPPGAAVTTDQQLAQQHLKKENPPKMPSRAGGQKKLDSKSGTMEYFSPFLPVFFHALE